MASEICVHILNVKEGDCSLIERLNTDRVTMIDICAGNMSAVEMVVAKAIAERAAKPGGNYQMCSKPTNPIDYLDGRGIEKIWRFILTHPDCDHIDGLNRLLAEKVVTCFWDNGIRREKPDFTKTPYNEADWQCYEKIIAKETSTQVVTPLAGSKGKYWNEDDQEGGSGDFLSIVAPSPALVADANSGGDINDASYVVVYRSKAGQVIFPGDSNDKTWDYILANHADTVKDAGILLAPHHGRHSDRAFGFLDIVRPRVTFFGCARSEHLAYDAWRNRGLLFFTANQCGNVRAYPSADYSQWLLYIENGSYAHDFTAENGTTTHQKDGYWFLCAV